jgi:hypothetical protein
VKGDKLTIRQLNRATLARQMLLAREQVPTVDAVERLGAMQAQEAKPPFIGLWTRIQGFDPKDLLQALHRREVIRATMMRGTIHLVSATDYVALRDFVGQPPAATLRILGDRAAGLDPDEVLPAARQLLDRAPRDFNQLRALLKEAFPKVNDRALGFVVRHHLPLVMVPTDDRWGFPASAAFTLAESWLGRSPATGGGAEALALRYLAAFGPATAADLQAWSGVRGMKPVLDGMRPRLREFHDERGRVLLDLPDAPRPDGEVPAPPRFLPDFDSLVLAHDDRTRVLADEHRGLVATKNLRIRATFLHDGFARGTWTIERKRGTATLRMAPFEPLPPGVEAELAEEGDSLLRFVEPDASGFAIEVSQPAGRA